MMTTFKKTFCRISTIFITGLILRYFINEYINILSTLEYLDCILIFISYIINYLFIEPYINYDIYDHSLDKNEIKKLYLKDNLINFASPQNPNNQASLGTDLDGASSRNETRQASSQNNRCPHYYYDSKGISLRTPWIANHSNGKYHYYFDTRRVSQPINSEFNTNLHLDLEGWKKLTDAISYDAQHPATYVEIPVNSDTPNGILSLGIKHYGNPSDPAVLYVKYFDLIDKEHMWDIWKKELHQNKVKYQDIWKKGGTEPKFVYPNNLSIWKEMDMVMGEDISWKAVTRYLESNDSFLGRN
uniref:Uncharacterized protein n=1 Tax=Metarhizium rileyi (strain RCEF 4871) TaxID=1649241 RepID=A0A6H0B7H8_METRR|nr:hypothetical protein [Metarhizium rileyi]QIS49117.1 hypothetical protein [Metarhizium rileyi]